ncbi:hypothetical protein PHISCL_06158 [Aspergillus sclerotialis]|uniref:BTB domain-containing protein n=1 Tax=Aspergillus sclerotialis TaxID=2070753 RepID=A0A3A2ZEW3_9EURO|nr:hypothetical protein PHISCL_06158 [Aspergillus sclerotialis]
MSGKLWDYFLRDDTENFQRLLANASYTTGPAQRVSGSGPSNIKGGSPGTVTSSSQNLSSKNKKWGGTSPGSPVSYRGPPPRSGVSLTRAELNARDQLGRTLLHHVASSKKSTAIDFAVALLEVPFIDIYAQDSESGWTALHRALYAGNATIAQALMARDLREATEFSKFGNPNHPSGGLIKIKDREGYSPFDVYGATITARDIKQVVPETTASDGAAVDREDSDNASAMSSGDDDNDERFTVKSSFKPRTNIGGDEIFTFGSNKNLNLGLGDQDDRQFPERVTVKRPDRLVKRFFREYQEQRSEAHGRNQDRNNSADVPFLVENRPIKFQNVVMSKLHTAILTNDPESNLFLCGFGPGGRLGTGDESTRFSFVCIETGGLANKKVASVALGQDHTLAITEQGDIFSWGSNKFGQLGYSLPKSNAKDDVPIQTTPRQIFNPFKKETIFGAAASSIHSVVFTNYGLYTFGKNEGQLGLVDSDARSLEIQVTPRRVGASLFSSPIYMVSAVDHATAILLQNNEVWVFSQYGYSKLSFPLDSSSRFIKDSFMTTRYDTSVNKIVKITSGGNTICALSSFGEVFTVQVNRPENPPGMASTTNPVKIRNSLSSPVRVWSIKKSHMAVKDVDVGQDGSIIICTVSGSAWRKEKRTKSKGGASKDYKFVRIPGLSRVVAVRSNAFGAFAVAQRECDITKQQIEISPSTLWDDLLPLCPFEPLRAGAGMTGLDFTKNDHTRLRSALDLKKAILSASDLESQFQFTPANVPAGTIWIMSTVSDARIPVHEFLLTGRSPILRKALSDFRQTYYFSIPDILAIEYGQDGQCQIQFQGVDFLTILNLAFFLYTDSVLDVWHYTRTSPESAVRYRQVRTEVMRVATHLGLSTLERAARLMIEPVKNLKADMGRAIGDPSFFESADVIIQLNNDAVKVHSQVICQRCPFFDTLFHGLSRGKWLSMRRTDATEMVSVDLKHIDRTIFDFVLRYMYADTEEQLFDEVRCKDLDDFIDLVIDVAFVANELMIDRLAQICQKMLGRFVNTRNVAHLLDSVFPCSVAEFKNASLEYICLNLEDLVTNRLLQGFDEDLFRELDAVCRENQLTYYPVSRGRNSDDYLFEKYPELAPLVESDRQERTDAMKLRLRLNRAESYEGRSRPIPEKTPVSPSPKPKAGLTSDLPTSPALKPKNSTGDLMFQMDDDASLSPATPIKGKAAVRGFKAHEINTPVSDPDFPALGPSLAIRDRSSMGDHMASTPDAPLTSSPSGSRIAISPKTTDPLSIPAPDVVPSAVWGSPTPSASKSDLKEIMAQASQTRQTTHPAISTRESSGNFSKLSQKERKKLQQQQAQEKLAAEKRMKEKPENPWQTPAKKTPMRENQASSNGYPEPIRGAQKPAMTLRQTVAGTPPPGKSKPESQPQSQNLQPHTRTPVKPQGPGTSAAQSTSPNVATSPQPQPAIQSIRHIPRPEPQPSSFDSPPSHSKFKSSSKSLASIFMQQQTEKNELHEAATAKHNLQDIQLEQEFQEWWDKESKRVQGISDETGSTSQEGRERDGRGGRGRGKGSSRPNKRRGGGKGGTGNPSESALTQQLSGQAKSVNGHQKGTQERIPSGNHANAPTSSHRRGGGRDHPRSRGRGDRERKS